MWDVITHPYPKFNGGAIPVRAWGTYLHSHQFRWMQYIIRVFICKWSSFSLSISMRLNESKDIGCRCCGTICRWQSEGNWLWNAILISYQLSLMLIIQLVVWAQCIWSSEGLCWCDNIWRYCNTSKAGATPRVGVLFFSFDIVCHWFNPKSLLHWLMWSRK